MIATGSGMKEENMVSAAAERFCRRFSLAEVQLATQDFSDAHLIGNGGFGKVYKGVIDNGKQSVAIKRLASNSNQGEGEFFMEIETLSKLRHVNLVSLIGYCNENGEMILVYEYIARGTLANHLYKLSRSSESDDCLSLTWKQRLKICIGAARGIDYLHTGTSIIHRDVKSTNILVDEDLTAKVSDFGLAKHFTSNSMSHVSTIVKGSFGYLDPDYFITCRLTRKSDTYAFGVVLLEVLCGRTAVDPSLGEDEMSLVMWAQERISKRKAERIVSSNLRDEILADCLKTFVGITKRCLNREPKKRPTLAQVVAQLEFALEQQDRKATTLNASRFLSFWSRVKPSGSRPILATQEEGLKDEHPVNVLPITIRPIPINELKDTTDNFSPECLIDKTYNGNVYRGILKSGQVVAIKKLYSGSLPEKGFLEQVSFVSSLKHENVVQLLGYCLDGYQQFLVYQFAPNRALHDILHGKLTVPCLSWAQRVKIAVGVAKGLEHIHHKEHCHYNITSRNILLFDDYEVAKLTDFGACEDDFEGYYHPSDYPLCPHEYYPPEHIQNVKLSWRSDVYSFGVLLVEMLTGRKVVDRTQPGWTKELMPWAKPWLSGDKVKEVVDVLLFDDYKVATLTDFGQSTYSTDVCRDDFAYYHPNAFPICPHEYYPPEHLQNVELSWRSDVYSFGVLLVEILTGREVVDRTQPGWAKELMPWAEPRLSRDKIKEVVDVRLKGDYPPRAVAEMARIAALCVHYEPESRPNMSLVVRLLNDMADQPAHKCDVRHLV